MTLLLGGTLFLEIDWKELVLRAMWKKDFPHTVCVFSLCLYLFSLCLYLFVSLLVLLVSLLVLLVSLLVLLVSLLVLLVSLLVSCSTHYIYYICIHMMSLLVHEAGTRWRSPLIMCHAPRFDPINGSTAWPGRVLRKNPHPGRESNTRAYPKVEPLRYNRPRDMRYPIF